MNTKIRSIQSIVEEQCGRWNLAVTDVKDKRPAPIITISRQTGTIATAVARKLASDLKMDLSGKNIINQVAENTQVREKVIRQLDEKTRGWLEDLIADWTPKNNIGSDEYFKSLVKTVGTIGKFGNHIILGRGAIFIIKPPQNLRIRFIAPMEMRVENVMREHERGAVEAKEWVIKTDANRKAFIRRYFNEDIDKPENYDLIINNAFIGVDEACAMITAVLKARNPG
ncbi:MAG: cytidylate kinase-like family protein [Myxococcota bacterium]|jgi:cytidylate kinase